MTWRAWATFATLCAIWGLPYFFIKLALQDLSPVCVAWGRITLAAIVLVPGHAFLGWQTWRNKDDWRFLETTMIGTADFDAACRSGQKQYDAYSKYNPNVLKVHKLSELRARNIWPME
jgi:hypothetical protein